MKQNRSRCQLLGEINEVSFAVNDLHLYLDTHPCDEKALTCCSEMIRKRKQLLKEYDRVVRCCGAAKPRDIKAPG